MDAEAFEEALMQLVLNAPLTLRFPPQGWLVRASHSSNDEGARWQRLMSKSFGGICKPGHRRVAANPEPIFTKAAAIVSALLLIYLGVETFLEMVDASRELKWATDRATTWEEREGMAE